MRPGSKDDAFGTDLPEPAAVIEPLRDQDKVLLVVAEGRCPRKHSNVRGGLEFGDAVREPIIPAGAQEASAKLGLLIDEDHAVAGLRGIERGRDTGATPTDDQHLAMRVDLVVRAPILPSPRGGGKL